MPSPATLAHFPGSAGLRRLGAVAVGALALAAAASPARAENRVALVIGNAAYKGQGFGELPNTLKDAQAIGAALKAAGFQVLEVRDASKASFREAMGRFSALVKPGDTALFYYAGHGLQAESKARASEHDNYLAPVDAAVTSPESVSAQTIGLTELLQALDSSQAGARLLILDACRKEPFIEKYKEQGAGLAWPAAANSRGVFIAFAAAPGQEASEPDDEDHGYFTSEILKQFKSAQGRTVSEFFSEVSNGVETRSHSAQSPWFSGTGKAATLVLVPGARTDDAGDHELAVYRQAIDCNQPLCLEVAAGRVATARLREDLVARAERLRGPGLKESVGQKSLPTSAAPAQRPPPAPAKAQAGPRLLEPLKGMPPDVEAFILARRATPAGQREIGTSFLTGYARFPRNFAEASRWLESAQQGGDGEAALQLGMAFETGVGGPKDAPRALASYRRADQLSNVDGTLRAGLLYAVGAPGVSKNAEMARSYLTRAAEAGSVEAMRSLGVIYATGGVLPQDDALARQWLHTASDKGYARAQAQLGSCYFAGRCGVVQDYAQAFALSRKAAEGGSALAAFTLAAAYIDGKGVAKDPKQGLAWLERSAALGERRAITKLGVWRLLPTMPLGQDYAKAYAWLRKGADLGDPEAMYGLARCYQEGWGVVVNWDESLKWLRAAAAAGAADAAAALPVFLKAHPGVDAIRRS